MRALDELKQEFAAPVVDQAILQAAAEKYDPRVALKNQRYTETVSDDLSG